MAARAQLPMDAEIKKPVDAGPGDISTPAPRRTIAYTYSHSHRHANILTDRISLRKVARPILFRLRDSPPRRRAKSREA
jgi:hypothetical protein